MCLKFPRAPCSETIDISFPSQTESQLRLYWTLNQVLNQIHPMEVTLGPVRVLLNQSHHQNLAGKHFQMDFLRTRYGHVVFAAETFGLVESLRGEM